MRVTRSRVGWTTFAFVAVAVLQIYAVPQLRAQTAKLAETARKSIVYIYFDVTDAGTGAKSTIQGTGFVVTERGYVLTASHLFRTWQDQTQSYKNSNLIHGTLWDKPGYVTENQLILDIVDAGDPDSEDVALLKLPDQGRQAYPTAAICSSKAAAAKTGDQLSAYGFPNDQNFQPVTVTLGTQNAPGGRWAAASDFTKGMSGGPVYSSEGFVVGLVKGGLDTTAVRWITPIQHANNFLTKAGFAEQCSVSFQDFEANGGTPGNGTVGAYCRGRWYASCTLTEKPLERGTLIRVVRVEIKRHSELGESGGTVRIFPSSKKPLDLSTAKTISVRVYDEQGNNSVELRLCNGDQSQSPPASCSDPSWSDDKSTKDNWANITWPISNFRNVDKHSITGIELYERNDGVYYFADIRSE